MELRGYASSVTLPSHTPSWAVKEIRNNCKKIANVSNRRRTGYNFETCTECNDGYAMELRGWATDKGKVGRCKPYGDVPYVGCIDLDNDGNHMAKLTTTKRICTKIAKQTDILQPAHDRNAQIRNHFASVNGLGGHSVAKCSVWKQSLCDGLNCQTKKTVRCIEVCKLKAWGHTNQVEACDSSRCAGDYGKPHA